MPKNGDVIAERYTLTEHLGDGGAASVWKARDKTLERDVAIKFLYAQDERKADQLREQFLREARLACAVKHRNVIQTMDFGTSGEGQAYMVMELLTGRDLAQRMVDAPKLTVEETVQIISLVLRGLSAIHDAGIVHRDLKPENVYLEHDADGAFPKILDFGIAKSISKTGSKRSVLTTKEGVVVGTPEYMSPEQARGIPDLDPRTDVWSVGVLLFELLTGRLPFQEPYAGDLIIKIATEDAPEVVVLKPEVGHTLSAVVARALARKREDRFQSAQEMQDALLAAAREKGDLNAGATLSRSPPPMTTPVPKKSLAPAIGLSGVATAIVIVIAALSREPPAPAPPPAPTAPEHYTVQLSGVPADAQIHVNGKLAVGPTLSIPNDGTSRLIEVQAPGMKPWKVLHPAGNNGNYAVRLVAADPVPAAEPAATGAPAAPQPETTAEPEPAARRAPRKSTSHTTRRTTTATTATTPGAAPAPTEAQPPKPKSKSPKVYRNLDF